MGLGYLGGMRLFAFLVLMMLSIQVSFSQGWRGVDVSFLSEMEGDGVVFRDENGDDIDAQHGGPARFRLGLRSRRICRVQELLAVGEACVEELATLKKTEQPKKRPAVSEGPKRPKRKAPNSVPTLRETDPW